MTHEDYIKRRDEIAVAAVGAFATNEEQEELRHFKDEDVTKAQQAIDALVLDVIGEGASFGIELERLEGAIEQAHKEDVDNVTFTVTTLGLQNIVKGES